MEQRVLTRLRKGFQVGSKDWNDVVFSRQRMCWTQDSQNGPYIEVSENLTTDELEEIPVERNTKENFCCIPSMHTMYGSLLGQINWLQSRAQFPHCHNITRCASMAVSPTVGDVKSLNTWARQNQVTVNKASLLATHWTIDNTWTSPVSLTETTMMTHHEKEQQWSLAESRERSITDGMTCGSLIDHESQKINKTMLSTKVPELFWHEVLWFLSVSPWIVDGHVH